MAYNLSVFVSPNAISAPIDICVPFVYEIPFIGSLPSNVYLPVSALSTLSVSVNSSVLKLLLSCDADIIGKFVTGTFVLSIKIIPFDPAVNVALPLLTTVSLLEYASRTISPSSKISPTFTFVVPVAPIATTTLSMRLSLSYVRANVYGLSANFLC